MFAVIDITTYVADITTYVEPLLGYGLVGFGALVVFRAWSMLTASSDKVTAAAEGSVAHYQTLLATQSEQMAADRIAHESAREVWYEREAALLEENRQLRMGHHHRRENDSS